MKDPLACYFFLCALFVATAGACSADYSGSLTYPYDPPQLYEWGSDWAGGVTIGWVVSQNPNLSWHYKYTLTVTGKNISHFIIEVSPDFQYADVLNFSGPGTYSVGLFTPEPSNPSMPENLYGIKFTPGDTLSATVEFDSWRIPVWGDFYGRCGGKVGDLNRAYNLGFSSPDTDPALAPHDGTEDNHILRPDSVVVPEPGTAGLLVALGTVGLALKRWRGKK